MIKLKSILDNLYTDDILLAYLDMFKYDEEVTNIHLFRTSYGSVVDSLRSIKLIRKGCYKIILFDYKIDELDDEQKSMYLDSSLFNIRELKKKINKLNNKIKLINNIDNLSYQKIKEYIKKIKIPTSIALDFIPRNEILSCNVNIDNINKIGAEKCFADILHEMTYYGLNESDVTNHMDKLIKTVKEIKSGIIQTFSFDMSNEKSIDKNNNDNDEKYYDMDKKILINKINVYNTIYQYWYIPYLKYLKEK